ncbi:MAG: nitrous oxide reductase family maturation protein NosD [Bacteroidia bacterium]|nr:nitrous oxide reductase family maturation protein NosD [Bacteroidia bacterium]MCC6768585.1 nitrous oxide reductase family maturation protein NosD [Bacteroidia bacterium]
MKYLLHILSCLCLFHLQAAGKVWNVDQQGSLRYIRTAVGLASPGDTIYVQKGHFKEGNITINKALTLIGVNRPVLDGQKKYEVVSIRSNNVHFEGFEVIRSGKSSLDDPGGIKVYNCKNVSVVNNILRDNFFGIYIQNGAKCLVRNNQIFAKALNEQETGNGIHCWKSDSLQIIGNRIDGHRDGIYFEFVTHSIIWRNISTANIRYGLHFMFSNDDVYIGNVLKNNGAGVAVMYTKRVKMFNNHFYENWGASSYGLLLKDITDSHIENNQFMRNTIGIYMEGSSRIFVQGNSFNNNGWGMKIQASCMDIDVFSNNFSSNTFDVSTNGTLVLNRFKGNFWDKYEGYDINKDGIGDVPFHPLSLFSYIAEQNAQAMILFRSFIVTLLERSERILPSLTPDEFIDPAPRMNKL